MQRVAQWSIPASMVSVFWGCKTAGVFFYLCFFLFPSFISFLVFFCCWGVWVRCFPYLRQVIGVRNLRGDPPEVATTATLFIDRTFTFEGQMKNECWMMMLRANNGRDASILPFEDESTFFKVRWNINSEGVSTTRSDEDFNEIRQLRRRRTNKQY